MVCDRFADSTRAYQGAGGGVAPALDRAGWRRVWSAPTQPDLTLVLDMPVEAGLERAAGRGEPRSGSNPRALAFHERLRAGFLAVAGQVPER